MPRITTEIKPLLTQIATDVGLAWFTGLDAEENPIPLTVYIGAPRTNVSPNYAVIQLDPVSAQWETMNTVIMDVQVKIYGFFKITDPDDNLEMLKLDKVDALITKLESSATYGSGLASLPLVQDFNLPDVDDEDWYQVEATFTCKCSGAWGA